MQEALMPLPRILKPKRDELKPGECLCDHCTAKCCRYFALPIDEPTTRKDYDYMRWFLLHDRASIFTDDETWYLLVHTECRHLQADNRCAIYETRPQICREYTTNDCEYDDSWVYDRYFETPEQVEEYAEAILPRRPGSSIRSPQPPLLPVLHVS
jgi:Fe-S-cluster containining protein